VSRARLSPRLTGRYRFAGLQPGRYDLKAELQGFGTVEVKSIVLTIGLEYPKDIQMGVQDAPGVGHRHR
jgi:hypothetical protein